MRRVLVALLLFVPTGAAVHRAMAEEDPAQGVPQQRLLLPLGVRSPTRTYRGTEQAAERLKAVDLALDWLAAHQSEDGRWDADGFDRQCRGAPQNMTLEGHGAPDHDVGVTALALLAFLAAGHTDRGADVHSATVRSGLRFLLSQQRPDGAFGSMNAPDFPWDHTTATYALLETIALTGDRRYGSSASRAVRVLLDAWGFNGWGYGRRSDRPDTALTGWVTHTLGLARRLHEGGLPAGRFLDLAVDDHVFERTRRALGARTQFEGGRVGYRTRDDGPARYEGIHDGRFPREFSEGCTAAALLVRDAATSFVGSDDDPKAEEVLRAGRARIVASLPVWDRKRGTIDLWYWLLGTTVMRTSTGDAPVRPRMKEPWSVWDVAIRAALLPNQRKDGDSCSYLGSWDPVDAWGYAGGRVYATAVATRTLLVAALDTAKRDATGAIAAHEPVHERERWSASRGASKELLRDVIRLLDAPDVRLRRAALSSITALGPSAAPAIPRLAAALRDPDAEVRSGALLALASIGPEAATTLPATLALLQDPEDRVRVSAATALGRLGPLEASAEGALLDAMRAGGTELQLAGARALYEAGRISEAVLALLMGITLDQDAAHRADAIELVGRIKGLGDATAEAIAKHQSDSDVRVRLAVAGALWRIRRDKGALVAVLRTLRESPGDLGATALSLLREMHPQNLEHLEEAASAILLGRKAPTELVHAFLLWLTELGPAAKPAVHHLLDLPGTSVHAPAVRSALRAIGGPDESVLTVLYATDDGARAPSVDAVLGLGRLLDSEDPVLREVALGRLSHLHPRDFVVHVLDKVIARVADPVPAVRDGAVRALRGLSLPHHPRIVSVLVDSLRDAKTRRSAAAALAEYGASAKSALPALERALAEEKDEFVREALTEAVEELRKVP